MSSPIQIVRTRRAPTPHRWSPRDGWIGATLLAATLLAVSVSGCNGGGEVACDSDRVCSASGLVCDRGRGVCVQCVVTGDCLGADQVCRASHCVTITPCASSRECPGLVCDAARGYCVECIGDVDCLDGRVCDDDGVCQAPPTRCISDRECSGMGQVCDTTAGSCVECVRPGDCGADRTCVANRCVVAGVDAGPVIGHDAGPVIGHDAGPVIGHDAGPVIGHDAGPVIGHDAGPVVGHDAGIDPCLTTKANARSTVGCNGGLFGPTSRANEIGGSCTAGSCVSVPGTSVSCVAPFLGDSVSCTYRCASSTSYISTGGCPTGSRCFNLSPNPTCYRDCLTDSDCFAGETCDDEGSCV